MQTIIPIDDKVLVLPTDEGDLFEAGVWVKEQHKRAVALLQQGIVVAVGPGSYDINGNRRVLQVKVGDRVVLGKNAGVEMKFNGKKHKLIEQDVIGAILVGEPDEAGAVLGTDGKPLIVAP